MRAAVLLHHVQVSVPTGHEDLARRFYAGALGLVEVDKPAGLAHRSGCWFRALADDGRTVTAEVHVMVEEPFVPARRAHPAFLLGSVAEVEQRAAAISGGGFEVSWAERDTVEGLVRFHCRDGSGNRVEVVARTP